MSGHDCICVLGVSILSLFLRCFFTKSFVHVWGRKSRSSVIKNRKSFHLVRVLSRQWRLINFRMHRSDDCRSWNFITNVNRWAHVSFWFWKKLNFLYFFCCKEIISCMFYLKDYQLQWISFWLNQFIRKTGQKIEIGNNEWHGAPFGEIETEPRNPVQNLKSSSELTYCIYKLCKLLLVCTFQNHYDENIWSCQRRK